MKRSSFWIILTCCISAAITLSLPHQATVRGREVRKTSLVLSDDSSPFAYSIASILDLDSATDNFLATQVWPSAREASKALQERSDHTWKVCEFGCGPGLPSIVAASAGCPLVVATDLDELGLELVRAAADEQRLEKLVTRQIDLTQHPDSIMEENDSWFQEIDLFVMADVFENAEVAKGAAALTKAILDGIHQEHHSIKQPRVWVFAQSDRAQREIYLESIQESFPEVQWSPLRDYQNSNRLWLVDLDETKVNYG
jgi:cyclopropane fatty-acyl-phospholipid synthase-like methyltransferase